MTKSLQEQYDDALQVVSWQARRIEYLETIIEGVTRLLATAEGHDYSKPPVTVQEPAPVQWVQVDSVERDSFYSKTSNSRRSMWRLRTTDGRQVNLFDHSDPLRDNKKLLEASGYWNLFSLMVESEIDAWTKRPIEVELVPDGSFWKVTKINKRPDFAHPDEEEPTAEEIDFMDSPLSRLIRVVKRGNFVILDTETTGLGTDAEICQIAIISPTGEKLLDTLVKPVRPIPSDATKIHGITNDQVKSARDWLNTNEQVWQLVHGRDVIVYNAEYDFRLLVQSEKASEPLALSDWHTISRACAMEAYAEHVGDYNDFHGGYRWHKLSSAAAGVGYELPADLAPHSAFGDCLMTLAVCRYLVDAGL